MVTGRLFGVLFFAILALFTFVGCAGKEDDRMEIQRLIHQGAVSAEQRDISALLYWTSEDFMVVPGEYNRETLRPVLLRIFFYYKNFSIVYPKPSISVDDAGATAEAEIYFLMLREGQSAPGLNDLYEDPKAWAKAVGDAADLFHLHLELRKDEGDWKVREATVKQFQGFGFSG